MYPNQPPANYVDEMSDTADEDITYPLAAVCTEEDSAAVDCASEADIYDISRNGVYKKCRSCDALVAGTRCSQPKSSAGLTDSTVSLAVGHTARRPHLSCHCAGSTRFEVVLPQDYALSGSHTLDDGSANSLYVARGQCPLSGHECIRKSILYAERVAQSTELKGWTELPVIVSASSSSSQAGYPVEENSGNDGTYSIVEELPSDHDDDEFSSENEILSEDDNDDNHHHQLHHRFHRYNNMRMYSDSMDDSVSSGRLRVGNGHQKVYEYLRSCLTAEENIWHCITRASGPVTDAKDPQNISKCVVSDGWSYNNRCDVKESSFSGASAGLGSQEASFFFLPAEESPRNPSNCISVAHCHSLSGQTVAENIVPVAGCIPRTIHPSVADGSTNETYLAGIILEPPRMFRSTNDDNDEDDKDALQSDRLQEQSTSVYEHRTVYGHPVNETYPADAIVSTRTQTRHSHGWEEDTAMFSAGHECKSGVADSAPKSVEPYVGGGSVVVAAETVPCDLLPSDCAHDPVDEACLIQIEFSSTSHHFAAQPTNIDDNHEKRKQVTPMSSVHQEAFGSRLRALVEMKKLVGQGTNLIWDKSNGERVDGIVENTVAKWTLVALDVLQKSDNSKLNVAENDILVAGPSQRLAGAVLQAVLASWNSPRIRLPAIGVYSGWYAPTRLSRCSGWSDDDDDDIGGGGGKESNGQKCGGNIGHSNVEWCGGNLEQMALDEPLKGNYANYSANGARSHTTAGSIESVNFDGNAVGIGVSVGQNENHFNDGLSIALYISNLEAIRRISDYFEKSWQTGGKGRAVDRWDKRLDVEYVESYAVSTHKSLAACHVTGGRMLEDSVDDNNNCRELDDKNHNENDNKSTEHCSAADCVATHHFRPTAADNGHPINEYGAAAKSYAPVDDDQDDQDEVTSFIFSSWDDVLSGDEDCSENEDMWSRMKDRRRPPYNTNNSSAPTAVAAVAAPVIRHAIVENAEAGQRAAAVLKSALKRACHQYSPSPNKCRVRFDETLNEFFEADYVILIRDNEDDDDDDNDNSHENADNEYEWCECGYESCNENCYRTDTEAKENDHDQHWPIFNSMVAGAPHSPVNSANSLAIRSAAATRQNTRHEPPHSTSVAFPEKVSASTIAYPASTQYKNRTELPNKSDILLSEKIETKQQYHRHQPQQQQQQQQQEHVDDGFVAKEDQQNPGYSYHRSNEVESFSQVVPFDVKNMPVEVKNGIEGRDEAGQSQYIAKTTRTTTAITESRIVHDSHKRRPMTADDILSADGFEHSCSRSRGSSGILKGGKFWRSSNTNANTNTNTNSDIDRVRVCAINADAVGLEISPTNPTVGDRSAGTAVNDKRGVKFMRENLAFDDSGSDETEDDEKGEFTLTFKLGNREVPCNSLKPNSAVRQLFPDHRFVDPLSITTSQRDCKAECACADNLAACEGKNRINEESLRAFNEISGRSVFANAAGRECRSFKESHVAESAGDYEDTTRNHQIKKTIERNTLRRSLIRSMQGAFGENRQPTKRKMDLSLEERIKLLTCDVDNEQNLPPEDTDQGTGTWSTSKNATILQRANLRGRYREVTASSPFLNSSTCVSTAAITANSTSTPCASSKQDQSSITYNKFTHPLSEQSDYQEAVATAFEQQLNPNYQSVYQSTESNLGVASKIDATALTKAMKSITSYEAHPQFSASSSAPMTSDIVSQVELCHGNREMLKLKPAGDRNSVLSATSTGTEYSIDDIDEALAEPLTEEKILQPVAIVDTPTIDSSQDELAVFVEQDANRIERIKKRYNSGISASTTPATSNEVERRNDEFGEQPSAHSVNSSFVSNSKRVQREQQRLQLPMLTYSTELEGRMTWPYYSTVKCSKTDNNEATLSSNQLPALNEDSDAITFAITDQTADRMWEKLGAALPTRTTGIPPQTFAKNDAAAASTRNNGRMFASTPSDSVAQTAMSHNQRICSCAHPRYLSGSDNIDTHTYASKMRMSPTGSIANMRPSSYTSDQVQVQLASNMANGTRLGAAYPTQSERMTSATATATSVDNYQQRTFRMPYSVSRPIQVHLLAVHPHCSDSSLTRVRCSAASSQSMLYTRTTRTPILGATTCVSVAHHRPQHQFTLTKGTQTSTVASTTSFCRLQTNAGVNATHATAIALPSAVPDINKTATAWKGGHSTSSYAIGEPAELTRPSNPVAQQSATQLCSTTGLASQNQSAERGIFDEVVSTTMINGHDCVKSMWQTATTLAKPIIISQTRTKISPSAPTTYFSSTSLIPPQLSNSSSIV